MPIVVRCSGCGALLKFRDDARGKRAKCTKCGGLIQVLPSDDSPSNDKHDGADFADHSTDAESTTSPVGQRREGRKKSQPAPTATATTAPAKDRVEKQTVLGARPRIRMAVLVVLLIPVVLASRLGLLERLMACIVPLMLTGTYRTSQIRGDRFTSRLHLAFFPAVTRRCDLRGVGYLNVKYGRDGSGIGTFILFGPMQVIFGRIFDSLMPSIGGPYQVHLVTAKGRELVAWQGSKEPQFRSALDLLCRSTKAELRAV